MKTITHYLMLACIAFMLSACASLLKPAAGADADSTNPASPTDPADPGTSISTVPEELRETVIEKKLEQFNARFPDVYINNAKLSEHDLTQYANGMHTLDIEKHINGSAIPHKMKLYQRNYSIAGVVYHPDAPGLIASQDFAFGGYMTPIAYFTNATVEYTYKGVAFTATETGQFTYNLSVSNGAITGSGVITGISEIGGTATLGEALFQTGYGFYSTYGPATMANEDTGYYSFVIAGPNAEEISGMLTGRDPIPDYSDRYLTVIMSGER